MRVVELIERKRDGGKLTADEIDALVQGYTKGDVPDYQMSAFCMAVVWRGMDAKETAALTASMVRSGERLDLARFGRVVDKHSTGGVGDKTTLVVAPLVAACGVPVAKMSGRGLGFSGGTLDKLESIRGYRVDLSTAEFLAQLGNAVGNSLEIAEAIATLRGQGPADLVQLTRAAGAEMLVRGRKARDRKSAVARIDSALADGSGFAKFRELVAAQGGDVSQVDDPATLPRAPRGETLRATRTAYVSAI